MKTKNNPETLQKQSVLSKLTGSANFGIFMALVVMVIIFTGMKSSYLSKANILNILISCSIVGLVAIGETYLMIAGQIDMSSGSMTGAFIGLMIMQGFGNGLSVLGVQSFRQKVAKGLLLIAALAFDLWRKKREKDMLRKMEQGNHC